MAIGIQNQYFGTEIEMTGITRQRAAEAVAELFGTRAVYDGGYYQTWHCSHSAPYSAPPAFS